MLWDPSAPSEAPLYILARWLQFSAVVVCIGALLFPYAIERATRFAIGHRTAEAMRSRVHLVAVVSALAALTGSILRLVMQRAGLNAALAPEVVPWRDLVSGMGGASFWLQLGATTLVLAGGRSGWRAALATLCAIPAISLAPGFAGHAAAGNPLALALGADAIHMLAAGSWIGMLIVLLVAAIPVVRDHEPGMTAPATRSMVGAFSPVALLSVALLAASGVYAGWRLVGTWEALLTTRYGHALIAKLVLVTFILSVGAANWLRFGPGSGTTHGASRFRASAWSEVLIAILIILVTAALTGRPSPRE